METPLISVLVPVYNVEQYLEECLESIINQKYRKLEIILVDDGSTDKSGEICDEYAKKDSRIKVIHQKNQGVAAARNVSIAKATGDYIGFVDSDDFIVPDMYKNMISLAEKYHADIVMCNAKYTDQYGQNIPNYGSAKSIAERTLTGKQYVTELCTTYNSIYVVPWNKIYRKCLFEDIQYPVGKTIDDEAVIHRIAHKCDKIVFTSKIYYFYRQQPTSIMNNTVSVKRFDSIYADLDRIDLLEKNDYENETVIKCKIFLCNDFITTLKGVNLSDSETKHIIKKLHKLIKPICKNLLRSKIPSKNEKIVIFLLNISPFLYMRIFSKKSK